MPIALRKTGEAFGVGLSPDDGRTEDIRDDLMTDPLHPMHRDLLARISAPPVAREVLVRPPRFAIPFYAGIAAWGFVWVMFEAAAAIF